jgi:hypothetical protein
VNNHWPENWALSNRSVSTGAKVIPIRALRTPATVKALTYFLLALLWVKHPGTGLPRRLMAQVLGMAARKYDKPMAVFVLPEICNRRVIQYGPSVSVAVAFERWLG